MKRVCFISLGSNLGNRKRNLEKAIALLHRIGAVTIERKSCIYETAPWGKKNQPNFYNMVLKCTTRLEPAQLLVECLFVEKKCGRKRSARFAPRVIDIDLLTYGRRRIRIDFIRSRSRHGERLPNERISLELPHPLMLRRRFVLEPLHEIAPHMRIRKRKITEYLKAVSKRQLCKNLCRPSRRSLT